VTIPKTEKKSSGEKKLPDLLYVFMQTLFRQGKKWSHILATPLLSFPKSFFSSQTHLLKGFSNFRPRQKVLDVINQELKGVGKGKAGAFFVLDLPQLDKNVREWKELFPTVRPFLAVKANSHQDILQRFAQTPFTGFDVASPNEIEDILSLPARVDPDRLIFAHPMKQLSHIQQAYDRGIRKTVFDSSHELEKLRQVATDWKLFLRFKVDDRGAQCPLSNKYGALDEECEELFAMAKRLGLHISGLNFHCGSGGIPATFLQAGDKLPRLIEQARSLGHRIDTIDIGGGFKNETIVPIANLLRKPIANWDAQGITVMSEPGRYFVSQIQTLVVQVIGKKQRDGKQLLHIADGLYRSFNALLYDHSVILDENNGIPTILAGQTCDGGDATECRLPPCDIYDWLVFPSCGAYTSAASTVFNGFPLNEFIVIQ
jgi:ornithine decarboxylase